MEERTKMILIVIGVSIWVTICLYGLFNAYTEGKATGGIRVFYKDLKLQNKYIEYATVTATGEKIPFRYIISFGMPGSIYDAIEMNYYDYNRIKVGCWYHLEVADLGQYGTYKSYEIRNITLLRC